MDGVDTTIRFAGRSVLGYLGRKYSRFAGRSVLGYAEMAAQKNDLQAVVYWGMLHYGLQIIL